MSDVNARQVSKDCDIVGSGFEEGLQDSECLTDRDIRRINYYTGEL